MTTESINDEILRIKHELAAIHGNDIRRIAADARRHQLNVVTLPPRPYKSEQTVAVERRNGACSDGESTHAAH
jgi:hypothetical protein